MGADIQSSRIDEREGFVQAQAIACSLERLGYEYEISVVKADFKAVKQLLFNKPLFIINLVEEIEGQCQLAYLVPAMLEAYNLNFSGSCALSYALTTNKIETKKILKQAGLPTPNWSLDGLDININKYIIKSVHEDASFGMGEDSVVSSNEVSEALRLKKQKYKGQWFAENYIDGREFNVALLYFNQILKVLPIAEIVFNNYPCSKPKIIDYEAKWDENSFAYKNTAREFLDERSPLAQELGDLAQKTWHLLGLKDYARIDFRVDAQGQAHILEVNANPSLAPDSGFIAAAQRAGIEFDQLIFSWLPKKEHAKIK
jgi:D-alanine-D-alanine ligase